MGLFCSCGVVFPHPASALAGRATVGSVWVDRGLGQRQASSSPHPTPIFQELKLGGHYLSPVGF